MTVPVTYTLGGYKLPDVYATIDDLARFQHDDLHDMDDRRLVAERTLVEYSYARAVSSRTTYWLPSSDRYVGLVPTVDWLEDRLARVTAEVRRRQGRRP
jgi:hypothetical protein